MEPKSLLVNNRFPREEVAREIFRVMDDKEWTQEDVCARTGVDPRVLHRVLHGPSSTELETRRATGDWVNLTTVDRLFTKTGLVHLFWDEPFKSVYFHESITDPCSWHKKMVAEYRERAKKWRKKQPTFSRSIPSHLIKKTKEKKVIPRDRTCVVCGTEYRLKTIKKPRRTCSRECSMKLQRDTKDMTYLYSPDPLLGVCHGKTNTYSRHGCRCEFCREAKAEAIRKWKGK